MDYLLFTLGAIFGISGTIPFLLTEQRRDDLPRIALSIAGLASGLACLLGLALLQFPNAQILLFLARGLAILAIGTWIAVGVILNLPRSPRTQAATLSLSFIAALSLIFGIPSGGALAAGLLAALPCAVGFWRLPGRIPIFSRKSAAWCSVGMLLLSVATFSLLFFGTEVFAHLQLTAPGGAIFLIAGLGAIFYLLGLWRFHRELLRNREKGDPEAKRILFAEFALGCLLILVLAAGLALTTWLGHRQQKWQEWDFFVDSRMLSAGIDREELTAVLASDNPAESRDYQILREQLATFCDLLPECQFTYLAARRDNLTFFVADSEPEDSPDHSPFGEFYPTGDGDPEWDAAFAGEAVLEGPETDSFGTWMSALVPIRNSTGDVIAIFGADIDIADWVAALAHARFSGILSTAALMATLIVAFAINRNTLRARWRLAASDRHFRTLSNTAPLLIWETDAEDLAIYFNDRWLAFTGLSPDAAHHNGWLSAIAPEDRDQYLSARRGFTSRSEPYTLEYRLRQADGSFRIVSESAAPNTSTSGRLLGYVGACTDVTESRAVEQRFQETRDRLQALVDSSTQISIIATDLEGTVTVFNPGAERMLGYKAAELVGKQTPALIHLPTEVAHYGEILSRETGAPVEGFDVFVDRARREKYDEREWTYVRKDGSHLLVSLVVTAIRNAAGDVTGFLGIAVDVTARREAEKERAQLLSRIQKVAAQLPGMIYEFEVRPDGSMCFPYSSDRIQEIYGVSPEDARESAGNGFRNHPSPGCRERRPKHPGVRHQSHQMELRIPGGPSRRLRQLAAG